jgi:hypothetical protein
MQARKHIDIADLRGVFVYGLFCVSSSRDDWFPTLSEFKCDLLIAAGHTIALDDLDGLQSQVFS